MRNRWRKGTAFVAALVLAIFCQTALSQQGSDTKPIVLKGATVIDGLGGSPISEAVVLIEGDRIKAVGAKGTSHPVGLNCRGPVRQGHHPGTDRLAHPL